MLPDSANTRSNSGTEPAFPLLISTLIAGCMLFGYAVHANGPKPQAEVLHWWSSAGESAALNVFIDEFKARGGHYYDSTKNNQYASREEAIDRMSKGYPSTLTQWNAGRDIAEFYDFGLIDAITEPSLVAKLKKLVPEPVLDAVTHRGEIIAMPINIHIENWMWHSTHLIEQSSDLLTHNWQDFITLGKDLATQDVPLLAVGDQPWQVRILFTSVLLGVSRDQSPCALQQIFWRWQLEYTSEGGR